MKKILFSLVMLTSMFLFTDCSSQSIASKEKNKATKSASIPDSLNWNSELIMKVETKAIIFYNIAGEAAVHFKIIEIVKGEFKNYQSIGKDRYFSIQPEWNTATEQFNFPIMPNKIQYMGFKKTTDSLGKNMIMGTHWKFDKAQGTRSITENDFSWDKDWPGFSGNRLKHKK